MTIQAEKLIAALKKFEAEDYDANPPGPAIPRLNRIRDDVAGLIRLLADVADQSPDPRLDSSRWDPYVGGVR